MKLGIVGGGRAAWAFGSAWKAIGRDLSGVTVRGSTAVPDLLRVPTLQLRDLVAGSEVVLVAVTDSALAAVAAEVAATVRNGAAAFHLSGSLSSEVFAPHGNAFSLHPLRSLPPVGERCEFSGTLFTFEGSAQTRRLAQEFVSRVGGKFAEITKEQKPLYHAAAVFASNYIEALLQIAQDVMREAGIAGEIHKNLAELAESAIHNWMRGEFTGPVARGDHAVIESHIRALAGNGERAELYRLLASALSKALQQKSF